MVASVGIVWGVYDGCSAMHLLTDQTSVTEAEPYGEFLTHPRGHFEVWEGWRRLGRAGRKRHGLPALIAWHEYEDFPRGRIVFHTGTGRFTLYADPKLQTSSVLGEIFPTFGLDPTRCGIRSDLHYRTACDGLSEPRAPWVPVTDWPTLAGAPTGSKPR